MAVTCNRCEVKIDVRLNLFVFGSCFRTLAVILFQIYLFIYGGGGGGGGCGLVYEYLLPARLGYIKMALIAAILNTRVMVTV